jgi:hypothetical protein
VKRVKGKEKKILKTLSLELYSASEKGVKE